MYDKRTGPASVFGLAVFRDPEYPALIPSTQLAAMSPKLAAHLV